MRDVKRIGLDLAKNIFYVHGVDDREKVVAKKKLNRSQVLTFFANLKPCLVGMEVGCNANYWAREINKLGHTAKLMPPQFVKPYVKSNKNDPNDAEGICEAVSRPNMRFTEPKTIDQQDIQSVHRIRERLVSSKRTLANEIRGLLGEYGLVVSVGLDNLTSKLPEIIADNDNQLTSLTRALVRDLAEELDEIIKKVERYDARVKLIHDNHPVAKQLTTIPGVGPLAATAMLAIAVDPKSFKNGREFAAYLGLVPRQNSSGGKQQLLGISKRGDKYIRTMLIHGTRVTLGHATKRKLHQVPWKRIEWMKDLKERRGFNKTAVAMANKNARIAWALMAKGGYYKPSLAEPKAQVA